MALDRSWRIGDIVIANIVESSDTGSVIQNILPQATPDRLEAVSWLKPQFVDEHGNLKAVVQAFALQTPQWRMIVDTCVGNDRKETGVSTWDELQTDFLEQLALIGFTRENVNFVLCTHLHLDHVGWNTVLENDQWIPTFPNAKYLFVKEEYENRNWLSNGLTESVLPNVIRFYLLHALWGSSPTSIPPIVRLQ